jgi:hypothetical protein
MNTNQKLVAELAKRVEHLENAVINAGSCDESDLEAIDQAHDLLADLRANLA